MYRKNYSRKKYYGRRRSEGGRRSGGKYTDRSAINPRLYVSNGESAQEENLYVAGSDFAHFNLDGKIFENVRSRQYKNPTKIQYEAIPHIMAGRDVLGMASTGSGKTAAFLLPMLTKTLKSPKERCLIVVPTRELANQITNEIIAFSKGTFIQQALIVGGAKYGNQIRLLMKEPQFVVATPGRLIDLYKTKKIYLHDFNNIVLDEVDRMLDMGFINDIELIISKLSQQKQSLFFSATMNSKAEGIARTLLKDPIRIEIKQKSAAASVDQGIIRYQFTGEKINKLDELLHKSEFDKVLVFSRTKRGADSLARELQRRGHKSGVIHGDRSLGQRNKAISLFRQNVIDVLVATDVAARGIDIPDISHIINFDEPATYNDYIHRIGRTGRIGKRGVALTFVK